MFRSDEYCSNQSCDLFYQYSEMTYPDLALHVDGHWIKSTAQGELPVVDPSDGSTIGHLPIAGPGQIEAAAAAAQHGFRLWSRMVPLERFRIITAATHLMRDRADAIASILTREQGKPLAEAKREVLLSADIIDFLAEEAKRLPIRGVPPRLLNVLSQTVTRVPVGPVCAFTPWNFPANLPSRKLGGALAAGCSVVIKPAEETPATCIEILRAFLNAGLPPGVLNLIAGHPAQISKALIEHPAIAKISFTGSVSVGRQLGELAARHLKRYTAELGGHAPVIVGPDADVAAVAKLAVPAKFRNAGQVCASPIRFLIHRSRYVEFRDAFVAGAEAIRVGPGTDPNTQMGPLIRQRRISEMTAFVEDAVACGGRVLCGGTRIDRPGYFFAATVLEAVPTYARAQREEPFGPIALLDGYDTIEDAIARANALPYGLAAFAFTNDLALAHRFQDTLQAGMVGINHFGVSQPETPFGGIKDSGCGHEGGLEGLLAYTDVKLVSVAS
jgi:succinate-semialdehyde dehydrogenase / glutarate-semialdehyde dehydrogenase